MRWLLCFPIIVQVEWNKRLKGSNDLKEVNCSKSFSLFSGVWTRCLDSFWELVVCCIAEGGDAMIDSTLK